ncbi:MAG: sorbosone dehydrogenase family protein [Alphaproteobacteria bacterium]|nr:sorbosone dehydrogenase family protein [Alphaproteobacteria bacterium]
MTRLFIPLMFAVFVAANAPADAPGMKHEVPLQDLPKPYATPAVDNSSQTVLRPNGWLPQIPKGFRISMFATGLPDPRWMTLAPNGDVFLAEPAAGKVALLRDTNGDGKADKISTFATGFDHPHGLAFRDGALYVGDLDAVWKVPYTEGSTAAPSRTRVTTQSFGGKDGHSTRDIAFGPDGTLYVAIGSAGNVETTDPPTRASVQKVNADGTLSTYASGLRNPVTVIFSPNKQMWVTVNERDGLGDNLPPDYATHVEAGGFYGWPYAYIGRHPDPTFGAKRPDMVAKTKTPDVLFQPHSAPLGLVFYDGAQFPAEYKGDAFVAFHGSWNSGNPHGYKVVRIHFAGGKPVGGYEDFVTGFWDGKTSPAHVYGRPAGLLVAKDGSLLIADDAGKNVWRVAYSGK